jgi:hypothetical protein
MRRLTTPLLAALAAGLLCAAPAAAESEPNDGIGSFEGPVAEGVSYTGTANGPTDQDWYVVYLTGPTLATFNYSAPGAGCQANVDFLDTDGGPVFMGPSRNVLANTTSSATFQVPVGTARYFLKWTGGGCPTANYQFSVSGGVVGGEGRIVPTVTGEPNDFGYQAWGPIGGGTWYTGDFDSLNDRDWLGFYITRTGPIDIEITNLGGGAGGNQVIQGALHDDSGQVGSSVNPSPNTSAHIRATVRLEPPNFPGRFWVQIAPNEVGQRWMVRLLPADLIVPPPPPPAPVDTTTTPPAATQTVVPVKTAECVTAETSYAGLSKKLRKAKKNAKKAKRRAARRKASKRVRSLKRKRSKAAIKVARRC